MICVGLNYRLHAAEGGFDLPTYPTLFVRFPTSFVGHNVPLVRPHASNQFDYECELALVIGKAGRHIPVADALNYVAGYSAFNDGSLRDYQFKAPQWTPGKNFDSTGSFGPVFVTSDELPPGGKDLKIETRVNGTVLQSSHTGDMVFDVPSLISIISEVMTLEPGDVISTGTPSGVGVSRKPQIFLKPGDVCEVTVEGIGTLSNPVMQES
jgi:2-keto-4-pentenoate hydratase/2-oxohepta-3-ene-1,7-dioic acid hydratase in catechol pathway